MKSIARKATLGLVAVAVIGLSLSAASTAQAGGLSFNFGGGKISVHGGGHHGGHHYGGHHKTYYHRRHHVHTKCVYVVYYKDHRYHCHRWISYGKFHSRCEADNAARELDYLGYCTKVRKRIYRTYH